ncbi:DUF4340 domain-containing protein [Pseudomonas panipatensis]|uniref:DUF4340 domain-containing protein n=1 Tax=Pseudomonas panipatensis TaxID=428992 RepID=A0A1G8DL34_9PSED|nr:DUF4340 domain-containing protein [Pseudomonas panipatensis]SDH58358.1 protein of unknown function [Pseudomonas panipatensis]SMP41017.1 protein of unknown function [Pseudomonas panipatensis]
MQRKSLVLLLLLALLCGGLYAWLQREPQRLAPSDTRYLPGLQAQQVSAVQIQRPGQPSIRVARQDGRWVMPAKADYTAAGRLIGDLLHDLAEARKVEPKTRDPGNFAQLELADQGPGAAVRLTLERTQGGPFDLLIGKAVAPGGRLVRKPGEDQVWLIDKALQLPPNELDWLDRRVTSIPFEKIAEVSVSYPGSETLTVFRNQAGEPNLQVRQLPKDARLAYEAVANGMATPFAQLIFTEAVPLDQVAFKDAPRLSLSLKTLDGASLSGRVQEQGGQPWLILERVEGFADGQIQARPGWAYRLQDAAYQALSRHLGDFMAKKS